VHDETAVDPFIEVAIGARRQELEKALRTLEVRERSVIGLRYGLDGGEPRTLSDVGAALGITRERVRQIETRALSKLRHPSSTYDLESLL
jgi:RNA polymerase primary sigma factor